MCLFQLLIVKFAMHCYIAVGKFGEWLLSAREPISQRPREPNCGACKRSRPNELPSRNPILERHKRAP